MTIVCFIPTLFHPPLLCAGGDELVGKVRLHALSAVFYLISAIVLALLRRPGVDNDALLCASGLLAFITTVIEIATGDAQQRNSGSGHVLVIIASLATATQLLWLLSTFRTSTPWLLRGQGFVAAAVVTLSILGSMEDVTYSDPSPQYTSQTAWSYSKATLSVATALTLFTVALVGARQMQHLCAAFHARQAQEQREDGAKAEEGRPDGVPLRSFIDIEASSRQEQAPAQLVGPAALSSGCFLAVIHLILALPRQQHFGLLMASSLMGSFAYCSFVVAALAEQLHCHGKLHLPAALAHRSYVDSLKVDDEVSSHPVSPRPARLELHPLAGTTVGTSPDRSELSPTTTATTMLASPISLHTPTSPRSPHTAKFSGQTSLRSSLFHSNYSADDQSGGRLFRSRAPRPRRGLLSYARPSDHSPKRRLHAASSSSPNSKTRTINALRLDGVDAAPHTPPSKRHRVQARDAATSYDWWGTDPLSLCHGTPLPAYSSPHTPHGASASASKDPPSHKGTAATKRHSHTTLHRLSALIRSESCTSAHDKRRDDEGDESTYEVERERTFSFERPDVFGASPGKMPKLYHPYASAERRAVAQGEPERPRTSPRLEHLETPSCVVGGSDQVQRSRSIELLRKRGFEPSFAALLCDGRKPQLSRLDDYLAAAEADVGSEIQQPPSLDNYIRQHHQHQLQQLRRGSAATTIGEELGHLTPSVASSDLESEHELSARDSSLDMMGDGRRRRESSMHRPAVSVRERAGTPLDLEAATIRAADERSPLSVPRRRPVKEGKNSIPFPTTTDADESRFSVDSDTTVSERRWYRNADTGEVERQDNGDVEAESEDEGEMGTPRLSAQRVTHAGRGHGGDLTDRMEDGSRTPRPRGLAHQVRPWTAESPTSRHKKAASSSNRAVKLGRHATVHDVVVRGAHGDRSSGRELRAKQRGMTAKGRLASAFGLPGPENSAQPQPQHEAKEGTKAQERC